MTKPVAIPKPRQPVLAPPSDSFARLTPLGWTSGLIFIVALLVNDGQPAFFPHPAYFTVLGVKLWFQVLHHLNLLDTSSLSRMPPATDRLAFDAAMTSVIR